MKRKEYIEAIMYRHFSKEASATEEAELALWIDEDPANRQEYDALMKIWNESARLSQAEDFDQSSAWLSVENRIISSADNNSNFKRRTIFSRPFSIAATITALCLLALVSYYLIGVRHSSSPIIINATAENRQVRLPDGSVIIVRTGSEIEYDEDFSKSNRNIRLSGEAFFDVVHNENLKFRIQTSHAVIEVVGTSFMINSSDDSDQVFVTRGRVKFGEAKNEANMVILSAGQRASLIGKVFERDTIENTNYLSWKSGVLIFEGVSLKNMVKDINSHYHANIVLSDSLSAKSDTIKVNFRFEKNSLPEVLDEIQLTTGLKVEKKNDSILLH
ncbi:MAG: FecR domain-containing protein [Bacteroidetes bacterium]|nr:FecR domain-containing protein [Bacteroidota bacterium]